MMASLKLILTPGGALSRFSDGGGGCNKDLNRLPHFFSLTAQNQHRIAEGISDSQKRSLPDTTRQPLPTYQSTNQHQQARAGR